MTKAFNPANAARAMREERDAAIGRVNARYQVYHYKNTCSMTGAVVGVNNEWLTGDKAQVNCPYCLARLRLRHKRKRTT